MNLSEIEALLEDRGLRLRAVVRKGRLYRVTVANNQHVVFDGTGEDIREALDKAIQEVKKQPRRHR